MVVSIPRAGLMLPSAYLTTRSVRVRSLESSCLSTKREERNPLCAPVSQRVAAEWPATLLSSRITETESAGSAATDDPGWPRAPRERALAEYNGTRRGPEEAGAAEEEKKGAGRVAGMGMRGAFGRGHGRRGAVVLGTKGGNGARASALELGSDGAASRDGSSARSGGSGGSGESPLSAQKGFSVV